MRRIFVILAVLASVLGFAGLSSANASTVSHHHYTALQIKNTGTGPWNIWLQNSSNNMALGSDDLNAGTMVQTVNHPGRSLTWNTNGGSYNGDQTGFWEFSNGNFLASNTNCGGVTIKSNSGSDGTVWTLHFSGGNMYIVNRYCDGLIGTGDSTEDLAGQNSLNQQFVVTAGGPGWYRAITLN